jgi:hypothetical protein
MCSATATAGVVGLVACGGNSAASSAHSDAIAVQLGGRTIKASAVAHWIAVLAPQHVAPIPPRYAACIVRQRSLARRSTGVTHKQECRQQYQALATQALTFLISSQWLIGEAARQGMPVTEREVAARLAEKKNSFANVTEFQESLKAIAHSPADLKLEIQAELAEDKIRKRVIAQEPKSTRSEIATYYRRHIATYHIPERRYFDIGENFSSAAEAKKKRKAVGAGKESIHESLPRKLFTDYNGEKRIIYEAIFKAKPHVVSAPIRLNNLYFLIDVTRITPPYVQSLAEVRRAIGRKLSSVRRRRALVAFIVAWRRRWTARTGCNVAYVVQKCRQYHGPKAPEDPLQLK